GLDIKLIGDADFIIKPHKVSKLAISPDDFKWLKPKLSINEGDKVKIGTPIIISKDNLDIRITSPISGEVTNIIRGEKRKIERIIISSDEKYEIESHNLNFNLESRNIKSTLLATGLWPFIKQRPFDCIANPNDIPKAIFISCFDSAPLAPSYSFILQNRQEEFQKGVEILSHLTNGKIFLGLKDNIDNTFFEATKNVELKYFEGPHPSGNIGTQIHHIAPISKGEIVWYVNPQDVATIGKFYLTKILDFSKIIALCGSGIAEPCYLKTIIGSDISSLRGGADARIISGNVLTGTNISESPFLRFYHNQVTIIPEGGSRRLFGWLYPGFRLWSVSHTYISWLYPKRKHNLDTTLHGGKRPMILSDVYNKVFPFDILPMELLKACVIKDIDLMEQLGIYEVAEEDFALCEVVCPSKTECQQIINDGLSLLKE
ncbi:Na(+)-translocating NADH-quinone reductase subunit A, partial [Bacteroidales bacterium OttesenSCG-928-K22]|nr:Na(+)-translocating NADH-quinone reductase subunit A [Bacteroidales bacterium OttesenSCG-928-K22]